MTEQRQSRTRYLDRNDIELIHSIVSKQWKKDGEPIPPFTTANEHHLDAFIKIPQSNYFDTEQYPSLASKAAIIFYTLNKKHLFLNGNKRLSVACLLIFLFINGKSMDVQPNEMTEKALILAKTSSIHPFEEIKKDLENWIGSKIIDSKELSET